MTLAKNGRIALDLWRKNSFNLILMDVQMPEMDGLAATKAIRSEESENSHIPIIAATANTMVSDRDQCMDAGMDDYITKPINIDRLQQSIRRVIKNNITTNNSEEKANTAITQELCDLEPLRTLTQSNSEQLKNLLQIFVNNFETYFTDLQQAVQTNDTKQIEFVVHKIKGSASQLKATAMSKISYELEVMGKEANLDHATEKFSALENIYREIKPILEAELEEEELV